MGDKGHPCEWCRLRGRVWDGDDPGCAFVDGQPFSGENWNCATANAIRDVVYEAANDGQPLTKVDYRYCEDQKYATVRLLDVAEIWVGDYHALSLWVSWYKSRGGTDAMWLLAEHGPPRPPTESECRRIAEWFSVKYPKAVRLPGIDPGKTRHRPGQVTP